MMDIENRKRRLNLVVDMYGCPNRCLHCWLGHMSNRRMEENADRFIVDYFDPYFDQIAYYSWLREPDFCDDYEERWKKDLEISKNAVPQRFELAGFFRIVRDENYIPFLRSVGVEKVQLSFFGLKETQDRYIGRKGAFEEILKATDLLIEGGIIPRWQCFINEENKEEIVEIWHMAQKIRKEKCPDLEFFVHEGSCDGENRKLYPIRIAKKDIPYELIPVYLGYAELLEENECLKKLGEEPCIDLFPIGDEITLNISNAYDVHCNFTNMSPAWIIGNLKKDDPEELVRKIVEGDTPALNRIRKMTWKELAEKYGDKDSQKAFALDDYKIYLVNNELENE